MNKLSVVIITYNEELNIADCINSIKSIADEIIVLDSFSTDSTVEISELLGAKVFQNKFIGHIEQKNLAKSKAKHELILSIDADERVSEELKLSIEQIKLNPVADAYTINRLNNYCGKWIRNGGWYPDVKLRIWKNGIGNWGGYNPHDEYIVPEGVKIINLKGELFHFSFKTIFQHIQQVNHFTEIMSEDLIKRNKKIHFYHILFAPLFKFVRDYFLRKGFLDGYHGFAISMISAFATFLKYVKIKIKKP